MTTIRHSSFIISHFLIIMFSSLRSRRLTHQNTEIIHHLVTFRLRHEWFALPVASVIKVTERGEIYGNIQNNGVGLTWYHDREIIVIEIGYCIFGESHPSPITDQYLMVIQSNEEWAGLPLSSPPKIARIPDKSLVPLPETYLSYGNLHCLSSQMSKLPDHPPIFMLDAHQLITKSLSLLPKKKNSLGKIRE